MLFKNKNCFLPNRQKMKLLLLNKQMLKKQLKLLKSRRTYLATILRDSGLISPFSNFLRNGNSRPFQRIDLCIQEKCMPGGEGRRTPLIGYEFAQPGQTPRTLLSTQSIMEEKTRLHMHTQYYLPYCCPFQTPPLYLQSSAFFVGFQEVLLLELSRSICCSLHFYAT